MRTLTRYIARLYAINLVVILAVLFSFVVSVDVVINLNRFTGAAAEALSAKAELANAVDAAAGGAQVKAAKASSGALAVETVRVILMLWGPRLLQLFNYLIGVVLIAAMGFTCAQLVRHREFVAMLASGISLQRAARPFVLVAIGVTLLQAVNTELLVPRVAHLLVRDAGDSAKTELDSFRVRLAPDDQGRLFSAVRFDDQTKSLEGLRIWERDADGRVTRIVSAESAVWDGKGWALTGGMASVPVSVSADRKARNEAVARVDSTLDPTRLKVRYLQGFGQALSWVQISAMLEGGGLDEQSKDRLNRVRWSHVSGMVSNVVTLFAALPLFLLRVPGPMLTASLKAAPVAMLGLVASAVASSATLPGLPVWLASFVPCLVLMPLAVFLYTSVKT